MNIIELHERHGGMPIFVNVDKIVSFHGNHVLGKGWEFSVLYFEGLTKEVRETQEQILMKIIEAAASGKPVVSSETTKNYRAIAPHSLW